MVDIKKTIRWRDRSQSGDFFFSHRLQHAGDNMCAVYARHPPYQRRAGGWLLSCCLRVLWVEDSHNLLLWHWYSPQVSSKHGDTVSRRTKRVCKSDSAGSFFFFRHFECKVLLTPRKNHYNITNIPPKCFQRDLEWWSVMLSSYSILRYYFRLLLTSSVPVVSVTCSLDLVWN